MGNVNYLFRLDDACPYGKWENWDRLITLFKSYNIRPLVAVIPDCQDPDLINYPFIPNFWDLVKTWQLHQIPFALHGLHHIFHQSKNSVIPLNYYTEFTDLSLNEQKGKICRAYKILQEKGIAPLAWVAPAHTFDTNTLVALREETPIRIISDGFSLYPFKDEEFIWVPQQLWKARVLPFGVYTVCLHPNEMTEADYSDLELFIKNNHTNCISWESIQNHISPHLFLRKTEHTFFMNMKRIKKAIKNIIKR